MKKKKKKLKNELSQICGMAVPDVWKIEDHTELLKPLVGIQAQCNLCGRRFIEMRALRQHLNFCRLKEREGKRNEAKKEKEESEKKEEEEKEKEKDVK